MFLSAIWGASEGAYSGVLAQTLALSSAFRSRFVDHLAQRTTAGSTGSDWPVLLTADGDNLALEIVTEKHLDGYGRADVVVGIPDRLTIIIENKIGAALPTDQLKRYGDYLTAQGGRGLLVLVTPSHYKVPAEALPASSVDFLLVNYRMINGWIAGILEDERRTEEMERTYLSAVKAFFSDVELSMNVSKEDLHVLKYVNDIIRVDKQLQSVIKGFDLRPEVCSGCYVLGYEQCSGFHLYFGFRYGTGWYYSVPLLKGECEAIVYVKDAEIEPMRVQVQNEIIRQVAVQVASIVDDGTVDFYERKKRHECRLAIRKSLGDFEGGSLERVKAWLEQNLTVLKQALNQAKGQG